MGGLDRGHQLTRRETACLRRGAQVQKVETGVRYVMSMWFTCDPARQFKQFLDGKMHETFVNPAAEEEARRAAQARAKLKPKPDALADAAEAAPAADAAQ